MRFLSGLVIGFIAGTFYALYQTVEASDGLAVKIMKGIKSVLEVF
ncbi:hypothetical protein [Sediminibacillus massiliensis]|nr:hypothetical protein [Sediminibacillus massiliensis]